MTKRWLLLLGLVGVLLSTVPVVAVGTVTFTCPNGSKQGGVWKCTWTWLSDGSGNVSANAKQVPYGFIIRFDTDPDGGSVAPDDNYDVSLLDTSGVDVLQAQGQNRDTANVESLIFSVPIWHDGSRTLDLTISGAGAANSGVLVLWIRQN